MLRGNMAELRLGMTVELRLGSVQSSFLSPVSVVLKCLQGDNKITVFKVIEGSISLLREKEEILAPGGQ